MKIKSIQKQQAKTIHYDIQVAKNQNFFANGILTHNCNFPARRVMILDDKRGLTPVHPYDIKQMGGRAGRPGIDPRGDVHWIVGDRSKRDAQYKLDNMPNAESLMFDIDVFCFHIVAEIAEGDITTRQQVWDYYNRTLASHQGALVDEKWINDLITKLLEVKAIREENNILKVTALGKIASWLYFSPFDIYHWSCNLRAMVESKRDDDAGIAWMWGAIRSNSMDYVPKDCKNLVDDFYYALKNIGPVRSADTACVGLWMQLQGKEWKDFPSSAISLTRNLVFDVERHAQALLMIDKMWSHTEATNFIKMCALRIAYGVDKKAAMFCLLPKIGKKRAQALVTNGILTIRQYIEQPEKCQKLVGPGIYDGTLEKAKELA